MLKAYLYLPFLVLIPGAVASDEQLPELRIQIIAGGSAAQQYSASIESIQEHRLIRSASLPVDGIWRFRDIPYGEYRLIIMSGDSGPVYEQEIIVNSQTSTIMVSLPAKMTSPSVSGTVSAQLLRPIDKKAVRSFKESQKLIEKGDFEGAARELNKAIEVSPGYVDAHQSLAAVDIEIGRYVQALNEISEAIRGAGPNARDLSNRALAYYLLGDYAESIKTARWALRLDVNYGPAHYILGAALAMDKRTMLESVSHLQQAARTIVSARATLAIVQKALSDDYAVW